MNRTRHGALLVLAAAAACRADERKAEALAPVDAQRAAAAIDERELLRHIALLSSDDFEGRAPGSAGEEKTVAYLSERFRELGIAPGNPDGTYVQKVPLVGFKATPVTHLTTPAGRRELAFPGEYVAVSRRFVPEVNLVEVPLVFVGYGVVAPEYGWDDFKDVDVRGKAVVMLVNDPQLVDPSDPSKLDARRFKGREMTYYGRWTYKYEIATEKGAAIAILVHETGPAGYPYEVVSGSWGRENFDVARADKNMDRVAIESWVREDVARELFRGCGKDFDAAKRDALSPDFRPMALSGGSVSVRLENKLREIESRNVIGTIEGTSRKDEFVVYTAHWDHLGVDPEREGDGLFNGAVDNASGVAGLLEIAQAFRALEPRPQRSIVFLAVTAEEKGLLGSKHYASAPLYPLEKTLACINMDSLNVWGRTRDVVSIGLGNSTLHDFLIEAVHAQGREVVRDAEPQNGYFFRSDHFEFAKRGVPGLHAKGGTDFLDRPLGWGERKRAEYVANDYHKPSDEIRPDWDLSGAIEDLRAFFAVGEHLSRCDAWPVWADDSEFKSARNLAAR
jgi:Zn-dependent M28 family amino/carboxypeptidase